MMDRLIINATAILADTPADTILIKDGVIEDIGIAIDAPAEVPRLDAQGCAIIPGLINTHHHMFQSLTRAQFHHHELFDWLSGLWGRWSQHNSNWQYAATSLASAELLLSGCTTTVDHHYLPSQHGDVDPLIAQAEAASRLGIRLVQAIGSMDISDRDGGLAPASLCEDYESYLIRAERIITECHDPSIGSHLQVALAPCHPLATTAGLIQSTLELARSNNIRLHTHMAEARNEEQQTLNAKGMRPLELLSSWGFVGSDVWLAHCVHLSDHDIHTLASTGTSVSVCPSSNLRLGSGVSRVRDMLDAQVTVSLGVDGSASNDSGNALAEVRQLMLTSRFRGLEGGISAQEAFSIATSHGAATLGRDDIGQLEVGRQADIAIFDLNNLGSVGTESDPLAGLLLSPPPTAREVLVGGELVVSDHQLVGRNVTDIVDEARKAIAQIV